MNTIANSTMVILNDKTSYGVESHTDKTVLIDAPEGMIRRKNNNGVVKYNGQTFTLTTVENMPNVTSEDVIREMIGAPHTSNGVCKIGYMIGDNYYLITADFDTVEWKECKLFNLRGLIVMENIPVYTKFITQTVTETAPAVTTVTTESTTSEDDNVYCVVHHNMPVSHSMNVEKIESGLVYINEGSFSYVEKIQHDGRDFPFVIVKDKDNSRYDVLNIRAKNTGKKYSTFSASIDAEKKQELLAEYKSRIDSALKNKQHTSQQTIAVFTVAINTLQAL